MKFILGLLTNLIPPGDATNGKVYAWRMQVALHIAGCSMAIMVLYVLSFGMIPMIYPGFASASEVAQQQAQLTRIEVGQLETQILDTLLRRCKAQMSSHQDAVQFASEKLQVQLRRYQDLTKSQFQLPRCDDL